MSCEGLGLNDKQEKQSLTLYVLVSYQGDRIRPNQFDDECFKAKLRSLENISWGQQGPHWAGVGVPFLRE